ncbi:hypothetical protein HK405_016096 [Cladochytrium tenue]|nr:hypothetical protein HK405_016096 [Cladochytrium tenue]
MAGAAPAPPPRRPPSLLPVSVWEQVLVTAANGDMRSLFRDSLVSRAIHCAVWAASPVAIARTLRRMLRACSPHLRLVSSFRLVEVSAVMAWMELLPLDQFVGVLALLVTPPASFGAPALTLDKHPDAAGMAYKRLPLGTSMRTAARVLRVFSRAGFFLLPSTRFEQVDVPFADEFYRSVGLSVALSDRLLGMCVRLAECDLDSSSDYSIPALIQAYKDWGRIREFAIGATRIAEINAIKGLLRTAAVDLHQLLNLAAASATNDPGLGVWRLCSRSPTEDARARKVAVPARALGVLETINALVAGGAQPGAEDIRGRNALDYFFLVAGREYDHGPWVQRALQIALSVLVGVETRPPLAFGPDAAVPETTEFLAARRFLWPADLDAAGKFTKMTPLFSAVLHFPVLVRILLAAGAAPSRATLFSRKPNRRRPRNWSLLHRAAREGALGAARLIAANPELLAACIDVKGGQTSVQAEFRRAAADAIAEGDIKRLRAILAVCGRYRSWCHADFARSLEVNAHSPIIENVFDSVDSNDLFSCLFD